MKIIVDADACPRAVLQITMHLGNKYKAPVWTVASFNHNIESNHHVMVGNAAQEADLKIMNLARRGDIVITQDWGLAAMVLNKGACCLSPMGREYRQDQMDFMLEEREIKARLRRAGGRTRGPRKRKTEDDQRFTNTLEACLRQSLNYQPALEDEQ